MLRSTDSARLYFIGEDRPLDLSASGTSPRGSEGD